MLLEGRGLVPVMNALSQYKSKKIALVVLGDGHYKQFLLDYAKNKRIDDKVFFAGNISNDELHD